ncbi:GNAT family N-acetyltransferase [Williamsia herbipolensis]|uniref:GNAT family N-acetyltransferase n=1 Tax=Williamsia herbipolensis TaxID=1603258 RepID=A0AAU4JZ08_9NOCA|nr:GNAT family N-acetyltransferase [Williamsia herbipolensis]
MYTSGLEALDLPVMGSLRGHHAHLARAVGSAVGFAPGVCSFVAVDASDPRRWDDLAALLGPGGFADMFSAPDRPPADWEQVFGLDGLQMVHDGSLPAVSSTESVVTLGPDDLPDILDLVERTRPGPFGPRTPELGVYLGIRDQGELVAMVGHRLRPPGWTEISAVCTAPEARGRGLAAHLLAEQIRLINATGDRPFLHVAQSNSAAISVYERLGFRARSAVSFRGYRVPGTSEVSAPR